MEALIGTGAGTAPDGAPGRRVAAVGVGRAAAARGVGRDGVGPVAVGRRSGDVLSIGAVDKSLECG